MWGSKPQGSSPTVKEGSWCSSKPPGLQPGTVGEPPAGECAAPRDDGLQNICLESGLVRPRGEGHKCPF